MCTILRYDLFLLLLILIVVFPPAHAVVASRITQWAPTADHILENIELNWQTTLKYTCKSGQPGYMALQLSNQSDASTCRS